jgi:hypothetical protein
MKIIQIAIGVALLGTAMHAVLPLTAMAEGALAVGSSDKADGGAAFGFAYDMRTKEFAQLIALNACRTAKAPSRTLTAKCRVVATFKRHCLAVASTGRGPGFAWAVEPDAPTAEVRAVTACQQAAGKKGDLCKVSNSVCDTQEKQ